VTKTAIATPQATLPRLVYENADLEVLIPSGEHKKQLSLTDFTRKIETQRLQWHAKRNQPPRDLDNDESLGLDENSFKP